MTEFRDQPVEEYNYRNEGEPRVLYHWEYRAKYYEILRTLTPNKEILPEQASAAGIVYALIGNGNLNWNSFDLRGKDRDSLNGVVYPGKSCHIDFTDSDRVNPKFLDMNIICDAVFGREC